MKRKASSRLAGLPAAVRSRLVPNDLWALLKEQQAVHEQQLIATGRQEARWSRSSRCPDIRSAEFGVFSQFGEDGIIQYLLGRVPIENETFIEFGVESYQESNTRFLLVNDNWTGLIMDIDPAHIDFVSGRPFMWRHTLTALQRRVTRDNVNSVISEAGLSGDVGLLSLDIDGNDYWVLEALEVVSPRILIIEYNSLFGSARAVTIPYGENFMRHDAHHSGLYWGASLAALTQLATRKGYSLIGSNSNGNNAFFVRNDVVGELETQDAAGAWVESRFREARDESGTLLFLSGHAKQLEVIKDLPLVDVITGETIRVADLRIQT